MLGANCATNILLAVLRTLPAKKGIKTTASQPTTRHLGELSASRVKLDNAFKAVVFDRFAKAISK
ncbi:Uncharacterised protein [Acinetobacter baumannii]|nr:Uncharacterised protein [Acinetobacter baumannii]